MVKIEIVQGPLRPFPADDDRTDEGSELVFNGRVRSVENDKEITHLDYEQYEGMAEKELNIIAEETIKKYHIHDLFCKHRIGKVFVGEISLHVVIWSKHRKEGLDAMTYFISELKHKVPIWKWAIYKDGTKVPSDCTHH